jgi:hypothetical protein
MTQVVDYFHSREKFFVQICLAWSKHNYKHITILQQ